MEKMNQAYEKVKMLVGMEVDEDDHEAASSSALQDTNFIDDFNRNCTLSAKQHAEAPTKSEAKPAEAMASPKHMDVKTLCSMLTYKQTMQCSFSFYSMQKHQQSLQKHQQSLKQNLQKHQQSLKQNLQKHRSPQTALQFPETSL